VLFIRPAVLEAPVIGGFRKLAVYRKGRERLRGAESSRGHK